MVENGKSIRFLLDIKLLYFSYTDNFLKIQKQGLCPCFFNLSRKMIVFLIFLFNSTLLLSHSSTLFLSFTLFFTVYEGTGRFGVLVRTKYILGA